MSKVEVTAGATVNDEKKEAKVYHDFGDDLKGMVEKYGEDLTYRLAQRAASKKLESAIRRELKAGTEPEAISDKLESWRPDVKHRVTVDPVTQATNDFASLPKEEREKALAKLKEKYG